MEKEHFEVLLEDMQGKFELVLEGLDGLNKKIDDAQRRSDEKHDMTAFLIDRLNQKLDERTGALDQKIQTLDQKVQVLDRKLDERTEMLSQKIDNVAAELTAHREDMEVHKGYTVYEK